MTKAKNASEYTKFQLFVLIYLYAREVEEGKLMVSDYDKRVKMTIKEFSNLPPPDIVPDTDVCIRDELDELLRDIIYFESYFRYSFVAHPFRFTKLV